MKKTWMAAFLTAALLVQGAAIAAERGTPEYEKLKELKRQRREEKSQRKTTGAPKEKNFFQREAERSGLAGTGAMFTNAVTGLVPLDKPNSRKEK